MCEGGAFIDLITHFALEPPAVIGLVKSRPQIVKDADAWNDDVNKEAYLLITFWHLVLIHQFRRKHLFEKKEKKMAGYKRAREIENATSEFPIGLKKPRRSLIR